MVHVVLRRSLEVEDGGKEKEEKEEQTELL